MNKLTKEVFEQAFQQVQEAAKTPIDSIACVSPENAVLVQMFSDYYQQASELDKQAIVNLFYTDKDKCIEFLMTFSAELELQAHQAKLEHKDE